MADDPASQNKNGSNDATDSASQMFSAFASAATKWAAEPTPDPKIALSFSLGWHVAQAWAWASTGKQPQDELGLEAELRWGVLDGQITAARKQLVTDASAQTPPEPPLGNVPPAAGDAQQAQEIEKLRGNLLHDLYVVDSSLGKAFLLGWELHALCVGGAAAAAGPAKPLEGDRRMQIDRLLRDLASKLPANAAHTVMNSLTLWDAQLEESPGAGDLAARLRQQGFVWYSMLAGEVAAKDLLRLSDYVGTGEEMLKRLEELGRRSLKSRAGLLLAAAVLLLVVLGLFLIFVPDKGGHVAAGVATLFAAIGISWKGIGGFFGRAAAKGEQALWDAQVDWTIAYRCTLPLVDAGADDRRTRRDTHLETWRQWVSSWPSLSGDDAGASG